MAGNEDQVLEEIVRMQRRMDRLFSDMVPNIRWMGAGQRKAWRPPTDVYETDASVIVKVEVAGMSEGDFAIALSNRNLSISGVRRDPDYKSAYQQLEIPYGEFGTDVFLPYAVDRDGISARYENGFLTVTLPKVKTYHVPVSDKTGDDETE